MNPTFLPTADDLVQLDQDHPGFRDTDYRARRNAIAQAALDYREGLVPDVEYSPEEQGVWRTVWDHLGPLHEAHACAEFLRVSGDLGLARDRIPQLRELNPRLRAATGFAMQPVAGLVSARTFLAQLGDRVFLSTQYIRHPSAPLYTPEPDVVHELVGHAATLIHPRIAELSQVFGRAAQSADDAGVKALEQAYWYTLEFGAVEEGGELKAFGAGLLSSSGEIQRYQGAELLPWDIERMSRTPYDPTDYQPHYFVAPSFDRLVDDLTAWVRGRFSIGE